jgi:hypothetical protein
LTVYDLLANEITIVVNGELPAAAHKVKFDAANLVSEIWFYNIVTNNFSLTKKLMLAKYNSGLSLKHFKLN